MEEINENSMDVDGDGALGELISFKLPNLMTI